MSDRFNFFDIYGYLLPGSLLLVLILLPFALLLAEWPPVDLGTAGLAVALAYIAGHILYSLSAVALPSTFRDKLGDARHPSDLLLDEHNGGADLPEKQHLSATARLQLLTQIRNTFGLDVKERGERSTAFFLCRTLLIQKKAAAYAEQQNGMYAMMRGVTASFVFASALYLGIAVGLRFADASSFQLAFSVNRSSYSLLLFAIFLASLFSFISPARLVWLQKPKLFAFWIMVFSMSCCGFLGQQFISSNSRPPSNPTSTSVSATNELAYSKLEQSLLCETNAVQFQNQRQALSHLKHVDKIRSRAVFLIFGMFILALCLAAISYSAFRSFAVNFAATVYRDFNALVPLPPPSRSEIASYAYFLYERDGKPPGNDAKYWSQAESELKSARSRDAPKKEATL